ncbi:MAG TPA: DNA mismatch repair endonuclease MutL [Tenericutes bacterium]|nr:DNA mismatch repair endonuclease MutL [Mycoplasmatota bacterium]
MAIIRVMDEILANKIAAGEVVERCASVVKELVENSIDAGAKSIRVELIEAGTREIKVIDDGKGMEEEDAILSFSRHATSKIIDENDLYNINTLGFRGEALASIASVSNIILKTSTGNIGTEVIINGGKIVDVKKSDSRKGTTIIVKDLFYNTPARLKHMKSLYTELASVAEYMNKLALSHPDIRFLLINNNSELLNTDGSNNLHKTISSIYGMDVARKMIEISGENDDYEVSGYITIPEINRSNRNGMITIVNGRVVRNIELNKTINDSYHSYKPDNRYPIVVINIKVDPSLIDVNIHPTKMDIKFSKFEELSVLIENIIKSKISNRNLIPNVEVKGYEKEKQENNKQLYENLKFDLSRKSYEENSSVNNEILTYEKTNIISDTETIFSNDDIEYQEQQKFPELYPVGLVHGTYIICQNELGMYIIDQHAAKERVNYEIYKEKLGNPNNERIDLLFPLTIELANNEFIILKQKFDIIRNLGFNIEEFGINSIIIKTHPTWLPKNYELEAIRKIIDVLISTEKDFSIIKFNEKVAIMLSCKMSIKANENITHEEMESLIDDLRKCDNPFNCPHGRPTIIHYSNYELEKLFKRSGF